MGTHTEDFVKLAQRIGQNTGGISTNDYISQVHRQKEETAWLLVRGKSTIQKADALLGILRDLLLDLHLDNQERFAQIVLQEKADVEAGLVPGGHIAAYSRLQSHYSVAGWVDEQIGGFDYLFFLRDLVNRIQSDWQGVLADLQAVHQALINRQAMVCNVTLDSANYTTFAPQLETFLQQLPRTDVQRYQWQIAPVPPTKA
jgi:presequence protease